MVPTKFRFASMFVSCLNARHQSELIDNSGIDREIVDLNFHSLSGDRIYEYLLTSPQLPRNNLGQISPSWVKRYKHCTRGGWWCAGLDPLSDWRSMDWGTFKPDRPTKNGEGKLIKYEHPPQISTRLFCLQVTADIWRKTLKLFAPKIKPEINVDSNGNTVGYWQWIIESKLPIIICEGVKKAACLLSHGYPAIALPGINSGYRTIRDLQGNQIGRNLIPELAIFSQNRLPIYICFDYETVPRKVKAIDTAIAHLGELFQQASCSVKVIRLPGTEKGVDDFIVARGIESFAESYQQALDLEIDIAKSRKSSELSYPADVEVNCRYLHSIEIPATGLVGIASPKGTGKTTALIPIVAAAKAQNRPVLLLTHRIQLGKFLCQKIGINWIDPTAIDRQSDSLGLCMDSIWKLNPTDWTGGVIILDEVEQSLWHLLHSSTCRQKRLALLSIFQQAIARVLATGGLVIAQDADLSDISIDYLCKLSQQDLSPQIVINRWKSELGWEINLYDTPNPTPLIHQLERDLMAGLKCYVATDSRSGRYGAETIDRYIRQQLGDLTDRYTKTLVICSQTTNTIGHPAVDFVDKIDDCVPEYDAVFVTPSIGTGVSIDVQHFDRVYGIFQGVIPEAEVRQAIARVRSNVPRHLWCAKRGIGKIASGSNNYRNLAYWYQENFKENFALMCPTGKIDVDLPFVYDPIHLRAWSKFAARINSSITLYRDAVIGGLTAEGHQLNYISEHHDRELLKQLRLALIDSAKIDPERARQVMSKIADCHQQTDKLDREYKLIATKTKTIRDDRARHDAEIVANAPDLTPYAHKYLISKRFLTEVERAQLEKYQIQQRYGIKVTPELKLKNDRGYYGQLLTHFYLLYNDLAIDRSLQPNHLRDLSPKSNKLFLPDTDRYFLKVRGLLALGIDRFIDLDREFSPTDADLLALKQSTYLCSQHIHRIIGIDFPKLGTAREPNPIAILNRFLSLLGLKVKVTRNGQLTDAAMKTYRLDRSLLEDGRMEIFALWHEHTTIELPICS